jgi:hypothetical protein
MSIRWMVDDQLTVGLRRLGNLHFNERLELPVAGRLDLFRGKRRLSQHPPWCTESRYIFWIERDISGVRREPALQSSTRSDSGEFFTDDGRNARSQDFDRSQHLLMG